MSATIAYESAADQAGWVQLPNVVLMDAKITMQARLLYALLLHYSRQDGSCYPGQERLGRDLGVSDRQVRDYLVELEAQHLVRRESRGTARSCRYLLLALGLRQKRLDEAAAELEFRRNQGSGGAGGTVPADVEAVDGDADIEGTRTSAALKISGRKVKPETWSKTEAALSFFNDRTGRSFGLLTGAGQPSEAAKMIYGRLAAWPDVDVDDIIVRTLASRWWGDDTPTIGVVFSPRVFEQNMTRTAKVAQGASAHDDIRSMTERVRQEQTA